jgi:predicted RNA binding protein YcfA (HicA-like mRNA interferase family)
MDSRSLDKLLEANGWKLAAIRGSHHKFRKTGCPLIITVPHPKKDLGTGLVKKILKDAGL